MYAQNHLTKMFFIYLELWRPPISKETHHVRFSLLDKKLQTFFCTFLTTFSISLWICFKIKKTFQYQIRRTKGGPRKHSLLNAFPINTQVYPNMVWKLPQYLPLLPKCYFNYSQVKLHSMSTQV